MRVVLIALIALVACTAAVATATATESEIISEEVSAAEENDFAVEETEQDEESGEFETTVIDDSDESEEDAAFMAVDEEIDSESEDEELMAESDEAENEESEEDEEEEEVSAIDEELVEEENVDVFTETTAQTPVSEVLDWLNKARTGDAAVMTELKRMKSLFTDKQDPKLMIDGTLRLETNEGVAAVNSAITAFAKFQAGKKAAKLTLSSGLSKAAAAHVKDMGTSGKFSHTGSDGSDPFKRMNRFGTWGITAGENMGSGFNTGKAIVMQYLVDDGVPSRGHRLNVLNAQFKKVGIAVGPHKVYKFMNVCDFAGSYTEKP